MKTVEMPKMGDTMEEGKILRWIKKEGDQVKKGEPLAEVETDKVNIEIESFFSGVLRKLLVAEGEAAPIGAAIALIGSSDEPLPVNVSAASKGTTEAASPSATATSPADMEKGEKTGEAPAQKPEGSLASDTTSARASAQSNGGTSSRINPAQKTTVLAVETKSFPSVQEQARVFISPIARRLAEEHNLDYTHLSGTGPNGRIIKMDVEAALAEKERQKQPITVPFAPAQPAAVFAPEPVPVTEETEEFIEIPLTSMRRTIAKRLSQSMQTAPHFYVTSVIDTGKLASLRQQINEYAANQPSPVKVSFNDLIVKAVAQALVRMPQVNVSFAEDRPNQSGGVIIQKKSVNIGIAVALEQGLIVPVLKDASSRGILDIAREARRLAEAAQVGKLRPEDLSGGTFTVSNLGMFDVESFTAVINPPESAILAVGSITPTPVVVDGQANQSGGLIVVRDRMKVTLSSDHRAIDGATAARFLQELKRLLEEPFGLLL